MVERMRLLRASMRPLPYGSGKQRMDARDGFGRVLRFNEAAPLRKRKAAHDLRGSSGEYRFNEAAPLRKRKVARMWPRCRRISRFNEAAPLRKRKGGGKAMRLIVLASFNEAAPLRKRKGGLVPSTTFEAALLQ